MWQGAGRLSFNQADVGGGPIERPGPADRRPVPPERLHRRIDHPGAAREPRGSRSAAANIIGEFNRLADALSRHDVEATNRLREAMVNTACTVDAAAAVAGEGVRQELRAFAALIRRVHERTHDGSFPVVKTNVDSIALVFRSCDFAPLPWIVDPAQAELLPPA
ncbi:hypothetical protein [Actinoplanes sp. NPDC023714]|uniref:hypothetical protein n=1 Tax=Actinoplanes sp. NPDC023714 TaxID=3154322 RepID=UPI0033C3431C